MDTNNSCGCCEGISPETPLRIHNRPGLSAVAYRAGTWATFRESMLAALSDPRFSALRALTTRENDDFTIALMDAWAVVGDVLTFYQERIANESWLGTATEQKSIVELARLIGYELRPGVAASTYLAFTMDKANLSEAQIQLTGNIRATGNYVSYPIPRGTRVQSIPGPNEKPQFFETVENIEAMAEWNAIRPKLTQVQSNWANDTHILVLNTANLGLKVNDLMCIVENGNTSFKKIVKLEQDDVTNTTSVYFSRGAAYRTFTEPSLNATAPFQLPGDLTAQSLATFWTSTYEQSNINTMQHMRNSYYGQLRSNAYEKSIASYIGTAFTLANVVPDGIYVFRKRACAFGYNALASVADTGAESDNTFHLDAVYENLGQDGLIIREVGGAKTLFRIKELQIAPRTAYGISAKISTVTTVEDFAWGSMNTVTNLRQLAFHVDSESVPIAESPIVNDVSGNQLSLSGYFPELKAGMPVILFGEEKGTGFYVTELRFLKKIYKINRDTVVIFDQNLEHTYIRKTLSINANVARATHGETVKETLGSGDASKVFQKFQLKQSPLTFTSAQTPSGTQTSLEVRVNDILWKEVPTLYGTGAHDKIYITRRDDMAQTTVIFGDGITGARLPTGQNNVTAVYRKGIGVEGLVKNDQLSQLLDRPLGVKAVTNPMPAIGAEDHEHLEDARKNATLTIYTLGRVVSLQDYEDFARAFAGIAKSLATLTWHGRQQRIHLTVAGYNGAAVPADSPVYDNLYAALQQSGIPGVSVELADYKPITFKIEAKIRTHPDYIRENVYKDAEARLRSVFSFENRHFGQGVARSEVLAVLQNTEGVVAVDLDYFYKSGSTKTLEEIIRADIPVPGEVTPSPAELLTIDNQIITFVDMP